MITDKAETSSGVSTVAVVLLVLCFALPGAFLSAWLIASGLDKRPKSQPFEDGLITVGTVVDVKTEDLNSVDRGPGLGDDRVYSAIVEFSVSGKKYTFTSESGDSQPDVGDRVEVSYDPDDPTNARDLDTNAGSWKLPFWTGVFVAAVEVIGSCALFFGMLRRRSAGSVAAT